MSDRPLTIAWITPERIEQGEHGPLANRVDVRLRAIAPMTFLRDQGHVVEHYALPDWPVWAAKEEFYRRDVHVFGKLFGHVTPVIEEIRRRGGKAIIDVCDNVFCPPEDGLRAFYDAALPQADHVVAASESLAQVLRTRVGDKVTTIADPVEGTRRPARFSPAQGDIKLLWYGYPNGVRSLVASLPNLAALGSAMPITLTMITAWEPVSDLRQRLEQGLPNVRLNFLEWAQGVTEAALSACDLVIIPTQPTPTQLTKTANRVLTALIHGRYVVANPLPSYQEFADVIGLTDDFVDAVRWAVERPTEVQGKIAQGQTMALDRYGLPVIGRRWERVLSGCLSVRQTVDSP